MENESIEIQENVQVLSVGAWLRNIFLLAIPVVNIALLINWAFGKSTNEDMKDWAKAVLTVIIIGIIVSLLIYIS